LILLVVSLALAARLPAARTGGCYFTAKGQDIRQPSQKVFITWDPKARVETFTVQPRFEGRAPDFALVIPTPSRPRLQPMPRDFFRHLAVFSLLQKRAFPQSRLLPPERLAVGGAVGPALPGMAETRSQIPDVAVLETGIVGALDYKIITAERAAELYKWLKDNKYQYAGEEATLNFYVQKRWVFTALKIDPTQLHKSGDGSYSGEVAPTRFQFSTDKLVYPLRNLQASTREKTEVLFYVQAPFKVDLPGDLSYQHTWIPMLQAAGGRAGGLSDKGADWLEAVKTQAPALLQRGRELGFQFIPGQRPRPNKQGRTPTTLEWARRLTAQDLKIVRGEAPYSAKLPDVDDGFTSADLKDPQKADAVSSIIRRRLARARQERPQGFLVRHATAEDVEGLRQLDGHLRPHLFVTRFRKSFTRDEMSDDLQLVPARLGQAEDASEYAEALPCTSP
jgi:hypothetical protein